MIDDVEIHVLREKVLTDPFGDVRVDLVFVEDARFFVLLEHRSVRIDAPHLDFRVALLEIAADAGRRPAGPHSHDELGDASAGLLPDLGAGLLVVRLQVRQVVVLIRFPRIGHFALQPRRHRVVRSRIFRFDVGGTDDHVGAKRLQRVDFLFRLLVRRREDALVAFDHRGDCQAHARVPGRPFDDGAARLEKPGPFGILDHLHRHAVFDRIARIERFELGQHRARNDAPGDPVDADQRRIADCVEDRVADSLHENKSILEFSLSHGLCGVRQWLKLQSWISSIDSRVEDGN